MTGSKGASACRRRRERRRQAQPTPKLNPGNRGEHHFLLGRGVSRSGDQRVGGINWMDWDELVPIPGLNQLVGHTPTQTVRYRNTPTSQNICLDTNLRHYAVFDGSRLEIKSYDALMVAAKAR